MEIKVLAIGENGTKELARQVFGDVEVDTTSLTPGKKRKDYDAILSYMALARVSFRKVEDVAKSWMEALKQGGEIVIFVPSLEWAAAQILSPEFNPVLLIHLFGMQDNPANYFSCGFTLMDLRTLCSRVGIAVTHASTGQYMIGEHACECHIVRGIKK